MSENGHKSMFETFIYHLDAATEPERRADWAVFAPWAQEQEPDVMTHDHTNDPFDKWTFGDRYKYVTHDITGVNAGVREWVIKEYPHRPIIPISIIASQIRAMAQEPTPVNVLDWTAQWKPDGSACVVGCQEIQAEVMEQIHALSVLGSIPQTSRDALSSVFERDNVVVDNFIITWTERGIMVNDKSVPRATIATIMDARPKQEQVPCAAVDGGGEWFAGLEWWREKGVRVVAILDCDNDCFNKGDTGKIKRHRDADARDCPDVDWDKNGTWSAAWSPDASRTEIAPLPLSEQDPDVMRRLGVDVPDMEPARDWDKEPWWVGDLFECTDDLYSFCPCTGTVTSVNQNGYIWSFRTAARELRNLSNPAAKRDPAIKPSTEIQPGMRVRIIGMSCGGQDRRRGQEGTVWQSGSNDGTWRVRGNPGDMSALVYPATSLEPIQ
jgi:hypothetical protein